MRRWFVAIGIMMVLMLTVLIGARSYGTTPGRHVEVLRQQKTCKEAVRPNNLSMPTTQPTAASPLHAGTKVPPAPPPTAASNNSFAFVTYVYGNVSATTVLRVGLWRQRLTRLGTDYVVIVPEADMARWGAVLSANHIIVRLVGSSQQPPPHCFDGSDPNEVHSQSYYAGTYHALHAFYLTEYDRIAIVDTDVLVRHTDVFELFKDGYGVVAAPDWPPFECGRTAYYQLGIFMIRPDVRVPSAMIAHMTAMKTRCDLAVQNGLNAFWAARDPRTVLCVPAQFNCQVWHHYTSNGNCLRPDVAFIHFSGQMKPWTNWAKWNPGPEQVGFLQEYNLLYAQYALARPFVSP